MTTGPKPERVCPACAASGRTLVGSRNGFDLARCRDCRTLYTTTLPGSSEAQDYGEEYRPADAEVPAAVLDSVSRSLAKLERARSTNRLLDLGFGSGVVLEAARATGWDAYGVEVSAAAIERLRSSGSRLFHGELAECSFPGQYFDVVVATELLEHVPDPGSLVREVARVLRPDGLLWITTPHVRGLSARVLGVEWTVVCPPDHLQLFSTSGIRSLLAPNFVGLRLVTEGLHVSELLSAARRRRRPSPPVQSTSRTECDYRMLERMTASPVRRRLMQSANLALRVARLGDSLKVWATPGLTSGRHGAGRLGMEEAS